MSVVTDLTGAGAQSGENLDTMGVGCTIVGNNCDKSVIQMNCNTDVCTDACPSQVDSCECSNDCTTSNENCPLTASPDCVQSDALCPVSENTVCSIAEACLETNDGCIETNDGCPINP